MEAARARTEVTEPDPYHADPAGLHAWLLRLLRRGEVLAAVTWIVDFIARLWSIQDALRTRVQQAKRRQSPSERFRALQAELPGLFAPPANDAPGAPPMPRAKKKRGPRTHHRHGRPVLPASLPRHAHRIAVPAAARTCPCCTQPMTCVDVERTERLERVPAHYVVAVTEREVLRCLRCQGGKVRAPAPDAVVDRGLLGERLLLDALVDHYRDAVPFERMARDARAQGVPLSANTLGRGVGKLVDLFDPIVQHIGRQCLASEVLALDATRLPVLDATLPQGLRSGTLWHLLGDRRWAYFDYAPTGHDHHLAAIAKGLACDVVLSDGAATHNVLETGHRVRAGCHAHARSKLVAAARAGDARAVEGIRLYVPLFVVEAQSKAAKEPPAQRLARRRRDSAPALAALDAWVDARRAEVEPRSKLGQAVGYLTRQRPRLARFLDDGRIELTNNDVESDLRTWVLNRKTWMFCGHEASARRAAAALTVLVTCRRLGVDPRAYLRDTLAALLAGQTELGRLLPENYVPRA